MSVQLRVLIVDDSEDEAILLSEEMQRAGYEVVAERVDSPEGLNLALDERSWDLVIGSYDLARFSRLGALALIRRRDQDLPFIVVADEGDHEAAEGALKLGAQDYVLRGRLGRLLPVTERALRQMEERRGLREFEAALRKSEERYRYLVENANDIVFTTDLQGNFTSLNAAGEQISGYTRSRVLHMNMADVLTSESLRVAAQMIEQKVRGDRRATVYELEMVASDGRLVPLELSTRLIYTGSQPSGILGIARDITERKAAAQALRESEERYRALFENASDVVYTHDLEGNITSVNRATERLTGYTAEAARRLNIAEVVTPEDLPLAREMIRRKLQGQEITSYELDIITADGRLVTLEINSQLIYQGGHPIGVQGIARDVTERRRVEAELRDREHKQAIVAELGQRALATSDLDALFDDAATCVAETLALEYCTVLQWLPEQEALLGRAGYGWPAGIVGHTTVGTGLRSQAGYTLLADEPVIVTDFAAETRFSVPVILREHGVKSGISVVIHGPAQPFGVLGAFSCRGRSFSAHDVHFMRAVANVLAAATERKRLEDERAQQSKELAARVLQAYEEERKRIARELHDETAQSLSVLLANLDVMDRHIPKDDEQLRAGFTRIADLARRTLDEMRALSHDLRPTILDDVGLTAALEWVAAEYEETYGGEVAVDAEPEPQDRLSPEVELALFRIAQEALTNTGKHAGARNIEMSLTFPDSAARLVVEDDGRGFDPEHVAGPTREGRLGLFGMRERAALLGGVVYINASPGKGTRVCVEIPLQREEGD